MSSFTPDSSKMAACCNNQNHYAWMTDILFCVSSLLSLSNFYPSMEDIHWWPPQLSGELLRLLRWLVRTYSLCPAAWHDITSPDTLTHLQYLRLCRVLKDLYLQSVSVTYLSSVHWRIHFAFLYWFLKLLNLKFGFAGSQNQQFSRFLYLWLCQYPDHLRQGRYVFTCVGCWLSPQDSHGSLGYGICEGITN